MSKKGSADLVYILGDAFRSLRENVGTTILTSFTLAFSLAIFSLFVFVITNLNAVVEGWGERTQMIVYVKDASVAQADALKQAVLKVPGVKSAEYVSKEKALAELKEELKGHESILDGVDANPLPASFEVRVADEFNQPERIAEVAGRIKALEWAEDVQYSREWVEKLSSFIRFIQFAAIAVGVFLGAATLFIISNTIRLAVYARKDEIEIMKLVGASDMYVKAPFVLEGLLQGFFGGLLALCVLALGRYAVLGEIPAYLRFAVEMPFSTPVFLAFLIGAGMLMGVAGSLISMNRFLKV
ncbi:Cell division protein FtsX [uncultured bacterium]|nr:Cell division protein FtsX [uncultured bacterium]